MMVRSDPKGMKYGRAYGGEDPQMIEGDIFKIIVKVPEYGAERQPEKEHAGKVTPQVTHKCPYKWQAC